LKKIQVKNRSTTQIDWKPSLQQTLVVFISQVRFKIQKLQLSTEILCLFEIFNSFLDVLNAPILRTQFNSLNTEDEE